VWIWEVNIDCWSGTDHTHWHVASCCLFPPGKFWIATQTRVHERPSTYLAIYYWPSSNHSPLYTATDSVVKQRTSTLFHIPEDCSLLGRPTAQCTCVVAQLGLT